MNVLADKRNPAVFESTGESIVSLLEDEKASEQDVIDSVRVLRTLASDMDEKEWYNHYLPKLLDALRMTSRWKGIEQNMSQEDLGKLVL